MVQNVPRRISAGGVLAPGCRGRVTTAAATTGLFWSATATVVSHGRRTATTGGATASRSCHGATCGDGCGQAPPTSATSQLRLSRGTGLGFILRVFFLGKANKNVHQPNSDQLYSFPLPSPRCCNCSRKKNVAKKLCIPPKTTLLSPSNLLNDGQKSEIGNFGDNSYLTQKNLVQSNNLPHRN